MCICVYVTITTVSAGITNGWKIMKVEVDAKTNTKRRLKL